MRGDLGYDSKERLRGRPKTPHPPAIDNNLEVSGARVRFSDTVSWPGPDAGHPLKTLLRTFMDLGSSLRRHGVR